MNTSRWNALEQQLQDSIFVIRNQKLIVDADLVGIYGVSEPCGLLAPGEDRY